MPGGRECSQGGSTIAGTGGEWQLRAHVSAPLVPSSSLELTTALGAKIRHWCKEDWCTDCTAWDHSAQLKPLPPCRAFNSSTNLSGFANTKGRERQQLGVSDEMPDVPAITFMVHSCTAPLKVSRTSPLHVISSVYLYW